MKLTVTYPQPFVKYSYYVSSPTETDVIKFLMKYMPKTKDKSFKIELEYINK